MENKTILEEERFNDVGLLKSNFLNFLCIKVRKILFLYYLFLFLKIFEKKKIFFYEDLFFCFCFSQKRSKNLEMSREIYCLSDFCISISSTEFLDLSCPEVSDTPVLLKDLSLAKRHSVNKVLNHL